MTYFFQEKIYDWGSWGQVYQSKEAFIPLIQAIFDAEHIKPDGPVCHLKPGTNAVFKAGSYVIKIFAPKESGLDSDLDFDTERSAMQRAIDAGVRTPRILAASAFSDKYEFKYILMDYVEGESAGDAMTALSREQKRIFAQKLRQILGKLNQAPDAPVSYAAAMEKAFRNQRWNEFSQGFKGQMADYLKGYSPGPMVHVHGDLTGDNMIMDSRFDLTVIDFADSSVSPREYEYPPIVFELFRMDRDCVNDFMDALHILASEFVERLFAGILLHDFGAGFVKAIYEEHAGNNIEQLQDLYEIRRLLERHLL
ncbi:phosphotransferase [Paenibacillus sp. DMB20]|uniref:phosphotransferase n=1 Tax=Paenibacillus sp. DMB20 TaxID=1642570 RepID=UPI000627E3CB|nr:phosphotransferase [Paenibacillus sp. DMB20]KKO53429.1 hypothetical protein XI25_14210 [Paenibacillus sp. DMB20]